MFVAVMIRRVERILRRQSCATPIGPSSLLNHCSFRDENRSSRDHPNPEKSTCGQLLNDSFKLDLLGFICGES